MFGDDYIALDDMNPFLLELINIGRQLIDRSGNNVLLLNTINEAVHIPSNYSLDGDYSLEGFTPIAKNK